MSEASEVDEIQKRIDDLIRVSHWSDRPLIRRLSRILEAVGRWSNMNPIVKVKRLHKDAKIPAYHSAKASGIDLCALESVESSGATPVIVRTGIATHLPDGYEAQIRPRSSMSKRGYYVALGTIDSDYRGEIGVCLSHPSGISVRAGDRIAQLVVAPIARAMLCEVDELDETQRGAAGWGSTGR